MAVKLILHNGYLQWKSAYRVSLKHAALSSVCTKEKWYNYGRLQHSCRKLWTYCFKGVQILLSQHWYYSKALPHACSFMPLSGVFVPPDVHTIRFLTCSSHKIHILATEDSVPGTAAPRLAFVPEPQVALSHPQRSRLSSGPTPPSPAAPSAGWRRGRACEARSGAPRPAAAPCGGRGPGWVRHRLATGNRLRRPVPNGRYLTAGHHLAPPGPAPSGMAEGSPTSVLHLSIIRWCVAAPFLPRGRRPSGWGGPGWGWSRGGGEKGQVAWLVSPPRRVGRGVWGWVAGPATWAYYRERRSDTFNAHRSFVGRKTGSL